MPEKPPIIFDRDAGNPKIEATSWPEGWHKYEETNQPQPIAAFEAWIPQIKSGILIGQGAQVKLEMAESDIEAALAIARDGRDKVLRVVIFDAKET